MDRLTNLLLLVAMAFLAGGFAAIKTFGELQSSGRHVPVFRAKTGAHVTERADI